MSAALYFLGCMMVAIMIYDRYGKVERKDLLPIAMWPIIAGVAFVALFYVLACDAFDGALLLARKPFRG